MRTKEMRTNEAGFTLIGMLIAVGIVAILAMIAVPKFTSAIASANTAKIQSDLSTIDTAIAVYEIEHIYRIQLFNHLRAIVILKVRRKLFLKKTMKYLIIGQFVRERL